MERLLTCRLGHVGLDDGVGNGTARERAHGAKAAIRLWTGNKEKWDWKGDDENDRSLFHRHPPFPPSTHRHTHIHIPRGSR